MENKGIKAILVAVILTQLGSVNAVEPVSRVQQCTNLAGNLKVAQNWLSTLQGMPVAPSNAVSQLAKIKAATNQVLVAQAAFNYSCMSTGPVIN